MRKWDCENGYFVPFFSHFGPTFLNRIPPQSSISHIPCATPAVSPSAPYFPPMFPRTPPFPPFFQTPKSGFGELVSSVAVSAEACNVWGLQTGLRVVAADRSGRQS